MQNAKPCDYCEGEGEVEIEGFMPQNFDRDVGYIDHTIGNVTISN